MGNQLTMADLVLVQMAVEEANRALTSALAVIEDAAARFGRGCPRECQSVDFGDYAGCGAPHSASAGNYEWNDPARAVMRDAEAREPEGRVIGTGIPGGGGGRA